VIYFRQLQLPNTGGRLIIASDGIWDAVSSDTAAQVCRGLPAELAAKLVVKVIMPLDEILNYLYFL
jgi:serine/threonine protein phosphatase PrpC